MKKKYIWTCDNCGEEYDTKNDCDKHEITCSKNPKNIKFPYNSNPRRAWLVTWITTILVFAVSLLINSNFSTQSSYLLANKWLSGLFLGNIALGIVAFLAMAFSENKPKNNKFSSVIKYSLLICFVYLLINPLIFAVEGYKSQHKTELNKAVTTDTVFPVDKLELQNIKYDGKVLTGSILNKGDKAAFNTEVLLRVSKDKSSWSVEEQHDFIVPYKIDPGQSINFSENFKIVKTNPWSSSYIVKAQYYNGEDVPIPSSTPTPKPKVYIDPDPIIDCKFTYIGTIRLKRSICNKSTDCQIGNKWIYYDSVDKCKADQNAYNQQQKNPNTNNQNNTVQKSPGNSFYCWDNANNYAYYTSSGDQCNLDNSRSSIYKICMNTQNTLSNDCKAVCRGQEESDISECALNFNNSVDVMNGKYGQCLNGPGGAVDLYGICLGKCTDRYGQDIKQCLF